MAQDHIAIPYRAIGATKPKLCEVSLSGWADGFQPICGGLSELGIL
jgi:hypothetical protein